jgi:hypothetical protein
MARSTVMTALTLHANGDAHPDVVWERYAQPGNWATWAPQIRRVEASAARLAPGMTGRVVGVGGVSVGFVVDDVDEQARRWSWRAHLGPITLHLTHGVRARPGGSATWLTVDGLLPVVIAYAPLARFALGRLVAA